MVKDSIYIHHYGLFFFKKNKGLYHVYQQRGRGIDNRYELGVCIHVKHRNQWFFLPFSKKWEAACASTRVEAVRLSMCDYIETFEIYPAPEDTAE